MKFEEGSMHGCDLAADTEAQNHLIGSMLFFGCFEKFICPTWKFGTRKAGSSCGGIVGTGGLGETVCHFGIYGLYVVYGPC